ncbi:brachyurin-like [Anopheles coustani]|uniref:brachyurin-like n=1 Tax=Anopheles coustani TaxID=139045 RepID=UPI002657B4BC|nr:brachyurin-like [Anopheles coustani]
MKLALIITIAIISSAVHAKRGRIIDGTIAELHEFPYQVSLQWNFNNGSRSLHFCSGSILNRKWILTAAHCMDNLSGDGWIEVVSGVNNVIDEEPSAQRRNVSRFIRHEQYNAMTIRNDIAVILLSSPLTLNNETSTIKLAPKDAVISEANGKLAGWGSISKNMTDIFPDELRKVTLPLRTLEECTEIWNAVERSQICGGGYGNVTGCTADSGGPLTVVQDNGDRVQIGVLSYGEKPCLARQPIVFSSVMYFHDWIQHTIKFKQFKWFP